MSANLTFSYMAGQEIFIWIAVIFFFLGCAFWEVLTRIQRKMNMEVKGK